MFYGTVSRETVENAIEKPMRVQPQVGGVLGQHLNVFKRGPWN